MTPSTQELVYTTSKDRFTKTNVTLTDHPHVLHLITGMGKGGAERVASQLLLNSQGNSSLTWLKGPNQWLTYPGLSDTNMLPLHMERPIDLPKAVNRLAHIIRQEKPDVMHTHLVHSHLVGRWAAKLTGVPVISTEHNLRVYNRGFFRWMNRIDVLTSRSNLAVIAISQAVRQRCMSSGYREETLQVIYNGVEIPSTAVSVNTKSGPTVTMVGRANREKGPDIFLQMLTELPDVKAILVGDGPAADQVGRMIHALGLQDRVDWRRCGCPKQAMSEADVIVVPSRQEGLGLVALEAMALAKPVVASRVGGLPEVVQHGETGLLCDPENPRDLARSVRALIANPLMCKTMGEAGRDCVVHCFSLDKMLRSYNAVYLQSVNGRANKLAA